MRKYNAGTMLRLVEDIGASRAEAEWLAAWRHIADACAAGLTELHCQHPRREELLALTRDARLAAGLPAEPHLRTA